MGRQLSRPFFPNSFFCLFIPCFIRLEGQSVDRTVREWSVGRSVGGSVGGFVGQTVTSLARRLVYQSVG